MILEVQFQISAKFLFSKYSRGPNINIFGKDWHGAFFYIKEQTQKYKFEIWLLKSTILDPKKVSFWFLKKTPPKISFFRVSAFIQL